MSTPEPKRWHLFIGVALILTPLCSLVFCLIKTGVWEWNAFLLGAASVLISVATFSCVLGGVYFIYRWKDARAAAKRVKILAHPPHTHTHRFSYIDPDKGDDKEKR